MQGNLQLEAIIEPVVTGLGFGLWGLEMVPEGGKLSLRVYIDDLANNVTVEDCAQISRQLAAVLDVEDVITSAYVLEVSSPGLDRVLFKAEQYQHYIDENLQLRLKQPVAEQRKLRGILTAVNDSGIELRLDKSDELQSIAWDMIERAQLQSQILLAMVKPKKPKSKKRKSNAS